MKDKKLEKDKKKMRIARKFFFVVVFLISASLIFSFGYSAGKKEIPIGLNSDVTNTTAGKPQSVDFSLFWDAWNKLKAKSVIDPSSQKMVQGAISGMLSSLDDPYTVYLSKEDNQRFREDIKGEFDGIGIEIVQKNGLPTVVAPLSDSPAEKAGIKSGDIIVQVDGKSTQDMAFEDLINKIRGQNGTKVTIAISRSSSETPLNFEVTRQNITVKSVEWSTEDLGGKKIFYIKMRQFGDDTESLFSQAANEAIKTKPDGIILDLRNNPGGYLDTAVNIASYFIKDGVIVSEKGRAGSSKDYSSNGNAKLFGYKTVILTNNGSASASEILAGALQDRNGTKIVGEKTFGKGSVQELIGLSDGSAVKITVASWYTPNGRQINKLGIEPDIKVLNGTDSKDAQLERAKQFITNGE